MFSKLSIRKHGPYLRVIQSSGFSNPVEYTEADQHDPGAQIINTLEIPALGFSIVSGLATLTFYQLPDFNVRKEAVPLSKYTQLFVNR